MAVPVRDWIPEVIDDVVAAIDPVRVIVFGSVARREERPESDLDLLVLFDVHRGVEVPRVHDMIGLHRRCSRRWIRLGSTGPTSRC